MRGVWGDGEKRILGSGVGGEMAMPEPPRDVLEASTVLDGLFAFRKDWWRRKGEDRKRVEWREAYLSRGQ